MKKLVSMTLLAGMLLLVLVSCKKKEEPAPDPTIPNNVATYQFNITGNYTDLTVEYLEHGSIKKEVVNPVLPWQMILSNFVSGDVASLNISCKIPANEQVHFSYLVGIGNGAAFNHVIMQADSTNIPASTETSVNIACGTIVVP